MINQMTLRRSHDFSRYVLSVSYHGAPFIGFSLQKNEHEDTSLCHRHHSIEFWLSQAIKSFLTNKVPQGDKYSPNFENFQVSSRTDRGVHALHNTFHVDLQPRRSSDKANNNNVGSSLWKPEYLVRGLNIELKRLHLATTNGNNDGSAVSNYLRVLNARLAPNSIPNVFYESSSDEDRPPEKDWNARYSATERTYMYRLLVPNPSSPCSHALLLESLAMPFEHDRSWILTTDLDVTRMRQAASHFIGTHDFSSFRNASCQRESPFVTCYKMEIHTQPWFSLGIGLAPSQMLWFDNNSAGQLVTVVIRGNAFLYRMVRNMVGLLVSVGQGKLQPNQVPELLDIRQRSLCSYPTAPASGLFLVRVKHGDFVI